MRFLTVAIPVVASVLAVIVASRLVPRPAGGAALVVGWWLAMLAWSTVVLLAVERLARRLLPLAVLLNLSMVFPDKAPDRFWVAFRAGTIRNLERRLADARDDASTGEPSEAAARVLALVSAMTAHDRRTRGHSERVRAFNDLIAEEMNLPEHDRDRLRWAALLHDIGKLRTSPSVLNKPGPPTGDEWQQLRRHPEEGARITAPLRSWLGPWAAAIEQHHERWDGAGYPSGLAGEQINLGARIVAVADAYEVMTSPRPYRRAMSASAARQELATSSAGSQFDPAVVRAFLNISIGKLRRVVGPIAWLLQLPFLASIPRLEAAAVAGRHMMATAGTAGTIGVLAVTGAIDTRPPAPATSMSAHAGAARQALASPQADAMATAGAQAIALAAPAIAVTPPSAVTTPPDKETAPGGRRGRSRPGPEAPKVTVPRRPAIPGVEVRLPRRPPVPVVDPLIPDEPSGPPVDGLGPRP